MKLLLARVLVMLLNLSCSEQQVYYAIQASQQNACRKQPPPNYDECMENAATSYNDYQQTLEQDR